MSGGSTRGLACGLEPENEPDGWQRAKQLVETKPIDR